MPNIGDEVHHTGWNACSSCHDDPSRARSRLIVPGLMSSRIHVVDVVTDPRAPKMDKVVEPEEMFAQGASVPHTAHCLADGDIMISCMADGPALNGKGSFVLLDGKTFTVKGTYAKDKADIPPFGYDFWYQPHHNVMISTEWGHICCVTDGLNLEDVANGKFGTHLNVFNWSDRKLIQRIDLGPEGVMPLEIR